MPNNVRQKSNTAHHFEHNVLIVEHGGGSTMVWGRFSSAGSGHMGEQSWKKNKTLYRLQKSWSWGRGSLSRRTMSLSYSGLHQNILICWKDRSKSLLQNWNNLNLSVNLLSACREVLRSWSPAAGWLFWPTYPQVGCLILNYARSLSLSYLSDVSGEACTLEKTTTCLRLVVMAMVMKTSVNWSLFRLAVGECFQRSLRVILYRLDSTSLW